MSSSKSTASPPKQSSVSVSTSSLKTLARKIEEDSVTESDESEPDPPVLLSKVRTTVKKIQAQPQSQQQKQQQEQQSKASTSSQKDMPSEPKKQKLASIFAPRKSLKEQQNEPAYDANESPRLVWRAPLKAPRGAAQATCLFAEYGEPWARAIAEVQAKEGKEVGSGKGSIKVAAFDLDGTLVDPSSGTWPDPRNERAYKPVFDDVYAQVKAEYKAGSVIAIVSNQKIRGGSFKIDSLPMDKQTWQRKLALVAKDIGCPLLVLGALADDSFRKPMTGMWDLGVLGSLERAGGKKEWICVGPARELGGSFYVGDAAGREERKSGKADHNDTDRKWAINIGIPFFTPEEYFRGAAPEPYKLVGYRPTFDVKPAVLPSNLLAAPSERSTDLVLFVGPPGAGKTRLFRQTFEKAGYAWVNQDTLKTRDKCARTASTLLSSGTGVVVDNTNRDRATRAVYVDMAQELGLEIKVRCVYFERTLEQLVHNNYYRAFANLTYAEGEVEEPWRAPVPTPAIQRYFKELQEPHIDEGFAEEPIRMPWAFEGNEEARKQYAKWWVDASRK